MRRKINRQILNISFRLFFVYFSTEFKSLNLYNSLGKDIKKIPFHEENQASYLESVYNSRSLSIPLEAAM